MARYVLHFDGLCMPRNPGGAACYGFQVARDRAVVHEGHGVAAPPGPESTSNVAEYVALVEGLKWLAKHTQDGDDVLVRGDSQLVVKQVRGEWAVRAERLRSLHKDATRLLKELPGARVEWVPRERNTAADALSRVGWENAVKRHPEWRHATRKRAAGKGGAQKGPRPATAKQRAFLQRLGVDAPDELSVGKASELIDRALGKGRKAPARGRKAR